jgi:hypothetical protein
VSPPLAGTAWTGYGSADAAASMAARQSAFRAVAFGTIEFLMTIPLALLSLQFLQI